MSGGFRRRRVLAAIASGATVGLAGCSARDGSGNGSSDGEDGNGPDLNVSTDSDGSDESSESESGPTGEELLSQTHAASDVAEVVAALGQNSMTLDFVPTDERAERADSVVFERFEGELSVALDLGAAIEQRHHNNWTAEHQHVEEFVNNIDDPEWRQQILEEAGISGQVDWETYCDSSPSYGERMRESNMVPFWYEFEGLRFDGVSSTNNQYKAQALHGAERVAGFDTFVWEHHIPGHGLVSAVEHPARDDAETDQQETYIVETDFTDTEQVATWENSQYQNTELHPVREDIDRMETGFYGNTAIVGEADLYESVSISASGTEAFIEFFRNPESSPAYDHLDPMATTAYIAEENIVNGEGTGSVSLQTARNQIKYFA